MTYYFDFDGTLVDVWHRFYHVFIDAGKISNVQFNEYKKAKLLFGKDEIVALHFNQELDKNYYFEKRKKLEDFDYLKMDNLLIDANFLIDFSQKMMHIS